MDYQTDTAFPEQGETVPEIREYWTVSRQAVVLSSQRARLVELAAEIQVPAEDIIEQSPQTAVLALWGDALAAYQEWARNDAH